MNEWQMKPIGYIRSSYAETSQVPKGLGAVHTMEGILQVLPEYEEGLKDIEGFSHLMILWVFHEAKGYELVGITPTDDHPHGVFATRSPRRPNAIGLTNVELVRRDGACCICAGSTCWMALRYLISNPIPPASRWKIAPGLAGGSGKEEAKKQ